MDEIVKQTIISLQADKHPQVVPLVELHRQIWAMARQSLNNLYSQGLLKEHRLLNDRGVQIIENPQN